MDTALILGKAAEYTKQFVDAAVPVVKQAYEVTLITLQIDAAHTIILCMLGLIPTIVLFRVMNNHKKACEERLEKHKKEYPSSTKTWASASEVFDSGGWIFAHAFSSIPAAIALINLCNIWIWVKLLKPELWLAHEAILKVLEVANK